MSDSNYNKEEAFSQNKGPFENLLDKVRSDLDLPNEIDLTQFNSIVDVFNQSVDKYRDNPAFSCLGHTLTFDDVDRLSDQFSLYLQYCTDLEKGDRVAVQLPNILQYPIVVFGVLKAGMVVVNTNPLYTPREMEHQFNDSGAKALVVLANMADKVEEVLPQTKIETVIVTEMADLHPPLKRFLLNAAVKYIKKMVPAYSLPTATTLLKTLAQGKQQTKPSRAHSVPVSQGDLAILQYTGGTTGVAKGAMLSHGNMIANMLQVYPLLDQCGLKEKDIYIAPLPLYHIYAFMLHCMTGFSKGGHSVLIPNPRDMAGFVKEISKWPFEVMVGLNTLFIALLNNKDFLALDFSRLKVTMAGGMALSESVAKEWENATGCNIMEGYGLTETSPVVSFNPKKKVQLGTIGLAVPATYIKTINDDGSDCAVGEAGELCVSGPQVMQGYWLRPDATAESIIDGWFLTGDVAEVGEDGFAKIVDRKKDMILVSGFNVYPNELENIVTAHPGVVECAAIGVPNEHSGEVVKMFVVRKDDSLNEKALLAYCREELTGYKVPKFIQFVDDLPKSNVGKILRRELRD